MPVERMPSSAYNPDLDWSQIRETVMMLNVALSQVERSMTEGDESVNALAGLFTTLMGKLRTAQAALEALPESPEKAVILENCGGIATMVDDVVIAFQFYDKLAQRLAHVGLNLSTLADLINDRKRLYSPDEWKNLQDMIQSRYYIDADRRMFEAILNGASVKEALEAGESFRRGEKAEGRVEVFSE
ncbi:MAG: hypothetical protein ACOZBW_04210 [Thermodesulfobacteriota bacterium]